MKDDKNDLLTLLDINRNVHEPARLLILVYLSLLEKADFLFLLDETGLTQGNLSSHIQKLEAAGLVEVQKEFIGKRPRTVLSLTENGYEALKSYRHAMMPVLRSIPNK